MELFVFCFENEAFCITIQKLQEQPGKVKKILLHIIALKKEFSTIQRNDVEGLTRVKIQAEKILGEQDQKFG